MYDPILSTETTHEAIVENVYSTSITVIENGQRYYLMKIDQDLVKGDIITYSCSYYQDIDKGSFGIFYNTTKAIGYGYVTDLELVERSMSFRTNLYSNLYSNDS